MECFLKTMNYPMTAVVMGTVWLPPWRVNEEPPLESAILGCALFLIGLSVSENHAGETPWSLAVGMI